MRHYKDSSGNFFGFDNKQTVPAGMVEVSIEEINQSNKDKAQADFDALPYSNKRAAEYPAIGDQLDALWKGGAAAEEMLAAVMAVKSKYPKPE
jgi:hypothetical protein